MPNNKKKKLGKSVYERFSTTETWQTGVAQKFLKIIYQNIIFSLFSKDNLPNITQKGVEILVPITKSHLRE